MTPARSFALSAVIGVGCSHRESWGSGGWDDDRGGFIATLLLGPRSLGGPSAIKAQFVQECTQLLEAMHGGPRGPEFHALACRVEHPGGDDRGGAVRGTTDEHDVGAPYFAVLNLDVGAERRVPWIVDA
ncbi:MAG: hypothetical protein HY701_04080 [Gemmatimonadetes bacterium]|nr:hypothetical protein [Gemmatimonadota bacterium]